MAKFAISILTFGSILMVYITNAIPIKEQESKNAVTVINVGKLDAKSGNIDMNQLNRFKRASVNKKRHSRRHRKGERRNSKHMENMIKAAHFVIPGKYSTEDLKTGPRGDVISHWEQSYIEAKPKQRFLRLENDGTVTVLESGLYMIYSQLTYFDRSGRWSHAININDEPFIKCLTSEWGMEVDPDTGLYYNTVQQCYTSAVSYLTKHDKISIVSLYPDRVIHTDSEMSFWGIIKFT